ncbi:MAG TPA: malonyl-ACP O-methyltransferase BioC [Casimicrobiaceae bacterium]|jgi:malonyl-CoA O-methyltransferase|nr:malonyl-ACP O-methyltransferase BioC [Casimicrobiaceae bacterium]
MATTADRDVLERRTVRRAFARAAPTYDAHAVLQREVAQRMRTRLDYVKIEPRRVADLGCGTGEATAALAQRYPQAAIVGVDLALPMLAQAAARIAPRSWLARLARGGARRPALVCADAEHLPLATGSIDLAWSNLMLQWLDTPAAAFAEIARVLATGGLVSFTTFGPDTLKEVRAAFDDGRPHVSRFVDMHDLGDALLAAGFADPVVDMEYITLTYATPRAMLAELKGIGATNALAGRARGLFGRQALARAEAALEATRRDGRIAATYEVIYGHAWKAAPKPPRDAVAVVHFEPRARR